MCIIVTLQILFNFFTAGNVVVCVKKHDDGTLETQYADGSVQYAFSDGVIESHLSSGNTTKTLPDGRMFFNGQSVDNLLGIQQAHNQQSANDEGAFLREY